MPSTRRIPCKSQLRRLSDVEVPAPAKPRRALSQASIATRLYGASDDYTARLLAFTAEHGWTLHHNQDRTCVGLLGDPAHRCSDRCVLGWKPPYHLDHTVLLRRGFPGWGSNYTAWTERWAILSQPYDDYDHTGWATRLGPAPYGHGTHALLYVGTDCPY